MNSSEQKLGKSRWGWCEDKIDSSHHWSTSRRYAELLHERSMAVETGLPGRRSQWTERLGAMCAVKSGWFFTAVKNLEKNLYTNVVYGCFFVAVFLFVCLGGFCVVPSIVKAIICTLYSWTVVWSPFNRSDMIQDNAWHRVGMSILSVCPPHWNAGLGLSWGLDFLKFAFWWFFQMCWFSPFLHQLGVLVNREIKNKCDFSCVKNDTWNVPWYHMAISD